MRLTLGEKGLTPGEDNGLRFVSSLSRDDNYSSRGRGESCQRGGGGGGGGGGGEWGRGRLRGAGGGWGWGGGGGGGQSQAVVDIVLGVRRVRGDEIYTRNGSSICTDKMLTSCSGF
uniref:Uncharacterized protein n=1 Tax=Knipowitschia caucasica TaxID=637954 RepID=A0AAV2K7W7_KNICA